MPQFAVIVVNAVPPVDTATVARVYRANASSEAEAVAAAGVALGLSGNVKVWACQLSALTSYRIDVTNSQNVALEP